MLDLADSYQQFPIKKEDRPKTAFTFNGRQLMFRTVPYGIKVMTGHMQRLMEKLLGPFGKKPFLDDTPIASKNTVEHIRDVKEILEALTYKAGLRLRLSKCKFFRKEARVLGSLVTIEGLRMDPAKVKAVVEWPRPVDGKAIQRFMGAVNFHRDFSAEFAKIAAPLESCRNTLGKVEWTPERIKAFEDLKVLFAQNLLLRAVDWNKTFYLTTDASTIGVGAWLGQKDEFGEILPVICASKKLTTTQQRWSTSKRELWAQMWAMEKFRYYLLGRQFISRMDHRPLVALLKNKITKLTEGWLDTILQFDFVPEYYPGESNFLADALSRCHDGDDVYIREGVVEIAKVSSVNSEIVIKLEAEKRGKELPNENQKKQLIQQAHALGHFSTETLFRTIWNQGYWWPRMRNDLKKEVHSCIDCLRYDVKQEGFHLAKSVKADLPWDHVQIDLIGPFPISQEGYNYVLTCVDVLTGYTVLRALRGKAMEEVARIMWEIIAEYET